MTTLTRRSTLAGGLALLGGSLAGCGDDTTPPAHPPAESPQCGEPGGGAPVQMPACELDAIVDSLLAEKIDAWVPLQQWLAEGVAPEQLYAAAHAVAARSARPEDDLHLPARVFAAYGLSQRVTAEHPLLPLFRVWNGLQGGPTTDTALCEVHVPPANEAEGALAAAIETADGTAAEGAMLALHSLPGPHNGGAGEPAVIAALCRYGQRNHDWVGHDGIWTAFALRSFDAFGWHCAPWILRGLARAYAKPVKDAASVAAYSENLARVHELPADGLGGEDAAEAVPGLLDVFRTGEASVCVDAVIAQRKAGLSPRTIWTALAVAAVELAVRYQHDSWGVHELDTLNALRHMQALAPDPNIAALTLLQAAAWRPAFRALNDNPPAFDETLDALTPAAGTPDLATALGSIAGNRVEAARTLAAYFANGGTPAEVIAAWPDVIVAHAGKDPHHDKYHLALLEEAGAALPEWRSTLLLGITMRGPSPQSPLTARYEEAQAIIASLPATG